jgi:hypothetical protein
VQSGRFRDNHELLLVGFQAIKHCFLMGNLKWIIMVTRANISIWWPACDFCHGFPLLFHGLPFTMKHRDKRNIVKSCNESENKIYIYIKKQKSCDGNIIMLRNKHKLTRKKELIVSIRSFVLKLISNIHANFN